MGTESWGYIPRMQLVPNTQPTFDMYNVCLKLTICVLPNKEGCLEKKKLM